MENDGNTGNIIGSICNERDAEQRVEIIYVSEENAFVTSGISRCFAEREILIPAHLVVMDLELIGAIVSAILEKVSLACERETAFAYEPGFQVLGKEYRLAAYGDYMKLDMV